MSKPENPRAFPGGNPSRFDSTVSDGMGLLDYFAGQALPALVALPWSVGAMVKRSYEIAAAMLEEREKYL